MIVPDRVRGRLRQLATVLGLLVLGASAVYGGDFFGVRTRLQGTAPLRERPPAVSRVAGGEPSASAAAEATRVRSAPWWQAVDTMKGAGSATRRVAIDDGALQWRVQWKCESGRLVVEAPAGREPVVDASCPGSDIGYSTHTGKFELDIDADGPWQLAVEQQIDVPLVEPPLPAMEVGDAAAVATGSFYDIDQRGRGRVVIYRLPGGNHVLRLEGFFVTPNVDLQVRLSPLAAPQTTEEYLSASSEMVARLDATAGSMNFTVPADIDPTTFKSVVIWCPPVDSAYAAASLTPPG